MGGESYIQCQCCGKLHKAKVILSDDDLIKDNNYTANKTHNRCLKCGYKITPDDKECPYCKEKVNIDNK